MKKVKIWFVLLSGAMVGLVNGLFGGGGGMIVVPMLNKMLNLEQKKAQASALFVILPISIISTIVYLFNNAVDFAFGWPIVVGIVAGGVIGAGLLEKLKNKILKILFVIFMMAGGIWMLVV